jgi:type II secretory pathway pseudopilin PulG
MATGGNQFGTPAGATPYGVGGQYGTPVPPQKSSNKALIIILVVVGLLVASLMVCGILVALLLPAVQAAREAARRVADANNLKLVGLAMHNYNAAHKKFPAPFATDSQDRELWSWRVTLLPYVNGNATYNKIDMESMKPWDDPTNDFLRNAMPAEYRSNRADGLAEDMANVFIIATPPGGPGSQQAAFTIGDYIRFQDFTDGTSNTILALMLPNTATEWAKPSAMTPDEAYAAIQREDGPVNTLMADGSVRILSPEIDRATFLALCTRSGNETIGPLD